MRLAEDYIDNYDDLCPHGKIICEICAREEEIEEDERSSDEDD